MSDNYLILGKEGQLGQALMQQAADRAIGFSRTECDLSQPDFLDIIEKQHQKTPLSVIFNSAAYTAVDAAEDEGPNVVLRINALSPGALANWCVDNDVALVHFSTDYVFDGSGEKPWQEADAPSPLNAYGRSKLAGERAILDVHPRALILRSSWLYASFGKNFFTTMCRLMREKEQLKVVDDQIGAPTYVPHLAAASIRAVESALRAPVFPTGVYHLCHQGDVSWHGFAQAIHSALAESGETLACKEILPISTAEFGAAAPRPLNSRLDCRHIHDSLDVWLPRWEAGLADCVALGSLS